MEYMSKKNINKLKLNINILSTECNSVRQNFWSFFNSGTCDLCKTEKSVYFVKDNLLNILSNNQKYFYALCQKCIIKKYYPKVWLINNEE